MQDAFGVERGDISKGLPSSLRSLANAPGARFSNPYTEALVGAKVSGRAAGRNIARGHRGAPMTDDLVGRGVGHKRFTQNIAGEAKGKMPKPDTNLRVRRMQAVSRNKKSVMSRPQGGGAPGSSYAPIPRSYYR